MELSRDDLELTLREMEGQRKSGRLDMAIKELLWSAGIGALKKVLARMPKPKKRVGQTAMVG